MAGSRIIDKIAILGIILALIITAAFMRGESLGIEKTAIAEESAVLTDNDLYADWDTSGATLITLTGDGAEIDGEGAYFRDGNLVIFSAGNYVLTGTLTDGSVVVDETSRTTGKTWILANGVDVRTKADLRPGLPADQTGHHARQFLFERKNLNSG